MGNGDGVGVGWGGVSGDGEGALNRRRNSGGRIRFRKKNVTERKGNFN